MIRCHFFKHFALSLMLLFGLSSCTIDANISKDALSVLPDQELVIESVQIENSVLVIRGSSLSEVTQIRIDGMDHVFQISSKTENEIRSFVSSALKLVANRSYNIIVSTASANTMAPITLILDSFNAQDGQILQYNAAAQAWEPGDLNGLKFKGSWNAQTNTPELVDGGAATQPYPGDYYIVDVAGSTLLDGINSWLGGDWVVYRSDGTWTRIANSGGVTSFNGRMGAVTPQASDYSYGITDLNDVDLTGLADGNVLKWDNANSQWIAASDETSTGSVSGSSLSVSGGGYVSGTLGVGTSSAPTSATLEVTATNPSLLIQPTSSGNSSLIHIKNDSASSYGGYIGVETTGGGTLVSGATASSMVIGQRGNAKTHLISADKIGLTVDTSGNVGVGTTSPNYKFHVKAAANSTGVIAVDTESADYNAELKLREAGTSRWTLLNDGTNSNRFKIRNESSTTVLAIKQDGSVGIGTSSPTQRLDVNGSIAASNGSVTVTADGNGNANAGSLNLKDSSNNKHWMIANRGTTYGPQNSLLFEYFDAAEYFARMIIDPSGNVGIGTTSPSSKLHVALKNESTSPNVPSALVLSHKVTDAVGRNGLGESILFQSEVFTEDVMDNTAAILGQAAWIGDGTNPSQGKLIFQTGEGGVLSDQMTIDYLGNVGIGTSSPSSRIHLSSDTETAMRIDTFSDTSISNPLIATRRARGTSESPMTVANNDTLFEIWPTGYNGASYKVAAQILVEVDGAVAGADDMPGRITFGTTADGTAAVVERMRITNSGNVGIGTTSPQTALDVNGVVRVAKYAAQPFACDAAHDSSLAITSNYRQCICNGGSTTWVFTSDGTTPCSW